MPSEREHSMQGPSARHFYGGAYVEGKQVPAPLARLRIDNESVTIEPSIPWLPLWRGYCRILLSDLAPVRRTQVGFLEFDVADADGGGFTFVPLSPDRIEDLLIDNGVSIEDPYRRVDGPPRA